MKTDIEIGGTRSVYRLPGAAYTINNVTISFPRCQRQTDGRDGNDDNIPPSDRRIDDNTPTIRRQQPYGFSSRIPPSSGQYRRNNWIGRVYTSSISYRCREIVSTACLPATDGKLRLRGHDNPARPLRFVSRVPSGSNRKRVRKPFGGRREKRAKFRRTLRRRSTAFVCLSIFSQRLNLTSRCTKLWKYLGEYVEIRRST